MRSHWIGVLGVVGVALAFGSTRAEAFPTSPAIWQPLLHLGAPITDPAADPLVFDDLQRDIVGDAANPAVFITSDADHLFLRIRLNVSPEESASNLHGTTAWGCMIDVDGDLTAYDYLLLADGSGNDFFRFFSNASKGTNTTDSAETELASLLGTYYARSSDTTSNFGGHPDKFIDLALPWANIRGGGSPIAAGTAMRFLCGSNVNVDTLTRARTINADIADGTEDRGPITLATHWSDPYVCNAPGGSADCVLNDADNDGIPDVVEVALGMNKDNADSDGDGISDLIEMTPPGGTTYRYTGVDTDGDGTIDSRDTDSDNDGVLDKDEAFPPPVGDAGTSGTLRDSDNDGIPNYRDDDDDNDGMTTKVEIADAKAALLTDDVDNDGIPNWLDTDSDGDGSPDYIEGRTDRDSDTIPNYLDFDAPPAPDAGAPVVDSGSSPPPTPTTTSTSRPPGPTPVNDAGVAVANPITDGVLEGTGLLCSSSSGSSSRSSSPITLFGLAGVAAAILARRSSRRRVDEV
jgi:MYXO-CTERM domain-containing protein